MDNKKGQAAMEFLMTYGWAILAAVIVVGVLWTIIGSPSNLAGDQFLISKPFAQEAVALSTTGISIEVRNGAGESVTLAGATLGTCTPSTATDTITDGSLQVVTFTCSLTAGDRFDGDLVLNYTTSGSSLTQSATGSISGRVP